MITKEQYEIALKICELEVIYISGLNDADAFKLYELCKGDLELMEKKLDNYLDFGDIEDEIDKFIAEHDKDWR